MIYCDVLHVLACICMSIYYVEKLCYHIIAPPPKILGFVAITATDIDNCPMCDTFFVRLSDGYDCIMKNIKMLISVLYYRVIKRL